MRKVDNIFNSMLGKNNTPTGPYIRVNYIESDSRGQYINTGILPSSLTDFDFIFSLTIPSSLSANYYFFGSRDYTGNKYYSLSLQANTGSVICRFDTQSHNFGIAPIDNEVFRASCVKNVWSLIRTSTAATVTRTFNDVAFGMTNTIYIGAFNNYGEIRTAPQRIYRFYVLINNVYYTYEPFVRASDGIAGLYCERLDDFWCDPNGKNFLYA